MPPILMVASIVLVDLIGFAIVMFVLPGFADDYGFKGGRVGLLMAAYPLCQLVAGPILGRLSDRHGRRPILVLSQAGSALSFIMLGLSHNYTVMLLAQMLNGASGGNVLVAQAFVADVTKPEDRARGLGLIGAAFGVAFVLGPLLVGLIFLLPVAPGWRLRVPFLVAAGFATLAWLLVLARLPESLPADARARQAARVLSWGGLVKTIAKPRVGLLVVIGGLAVLGFAALEGTFILFLKKSPWVAESALIRYLKTLPWAADSVELASFGFTFAFLGLVNATVQGGLIRRLIPRFGEPKLILAGLATLAAGLAALGFVASWPALLAALLVVGVGQGLTNPAITGLLSRLSPASEQGAIFGTLVAAQTVARMANYLVANVLLGRWGPSAPFWEASAVLVVALILALGLVRGLIAPDAMTRLDRQAEVAAPRT